MAYLLRPWDREWFKRCRRAWDFGSRTRLNLESRTPRWSTDVDRALRDALAVYYFPGMWEWNRAVVLPLTYHAFDRTMEKQRARFEDAAVLTPERAEAHEQAAARGRELLGRYLEWAPAVDRFWPVRVESDFDVQVPDLRHPGSDLVSPDAQPIRYTGRIDMLVVDEHDAYWIVRHRYVDAGFTDLDLLLLDDEPVAACWAWEIFYIGMRIAGTIHNELRLGGDPPDPAEPVRRPRASHAFARARAANRGSGHRRMYAQAEREPDEIVVEEGGDMFRRTRIPRGRPEVEHLGERLQLEILEMVDPDLAIYPTPVAEHCTRCDYRSPCVALNQSGDVQEILSRDYTIRPDDEPEEGRLGGVTWSMSRGAAPPTRWRGRQR